MFLCEIMRNYVRNACFYAFLCIKALSEVPTFPPGENILKKCTFYVRKEGTTIIIIIIVRWIEGGGKRDFHHCSLWHSGLGEKDTHNASVVGKNKLVRGCSPQR